MNFMPNPSADWNQYNSLLGDENKQKLKNGLILAMAPTLGSMMGIAPPDKSNSTSTNLPSLSQANPSFDSSLSGPQPNGPSLMPQVPGALPGLGGGSPLGIGADALDADAASGAIDALFMV
jgi:hypothetical protein